MRIKVYGLYIGLSVYGLNLRLLLLPLLLLFVMLTADPILHPRLVGGCQTNDGVKNRKL